jgi:hypothetical protein
MKNPAINTTPAPQAMSFVTAAITAGVETNRAALDAIKENKPTKAEAKRVTPALAAKLAKATAPQTAATKVQIVDTDPNALNTKTEAYKLFTALKKSNEAIYAFFAAHEADLFKEVATGRQLDTANAYKKFFEVNHSRGAAVPLKEYSLYKEFSNKLAYWVKEVAGIKPITKPSSTTPSNAVQAYLTKHEDDAQAIPAIKSFIAKVMTKREWDAFKKQMDDAFAGIAPRTVSTKKNAA